MTAPGEGLACLRELSCLGALPPIACIEYQDWRRGLSRSEHPSFCLKIQVNGQGLDVAPFTARI